MSNHHIFISYFFILKKSIERFQVTILARTRLRKTRERSTGHALAIDMALDDNLLSPKSKLENSFSANLSAFKLIFIETENQLNMLKGQR